MCTFSSKGLGSLCRPILYGVRNPIYQEHHVYFCRGSPIFQKWDVVGSPTRILEPILNSDMVCLNIFGKGVVTYVYLVCLSLCFNCCSFFILCILKSIKSYSVEMLQKKCKVLKIVLHDLKGNHYEIIAFVCLWMLFGVAIRNVATGANDDVFCITKNVQTSDPNVNDELGFERNRVEDDL